MPDIDTVIKALKICTGEEDFQFCIQRKCPYSGSEPGYCITNLERDALTLLIEKRKERDGHVAQVL